MNFWQYIATNYTEILVLLLEHIKLTAISVGLAILIGVPLGIFISYMSKASKIVLSIANVIQAIPSMALLGFMIPFLGIGALPAITAVVLYSLLPIIKNTYTGLESINPQTLEAAKGIGLTRFQILTKVQIPLALPVIMTGVRVASVTAVGLMTMAAFIGAGGLGNLVFS
ncbi:MAG: ABC transporter permease, partial [Acutalibacteraceae bacterium]|nr:ABC transporter permease [Acutalibacteraceae bacterium]